MISCTITVSGHGQIVVPPDIAEIRVMAQGFSKDPKEAQRLHTAELNSAILIVGSMGIDRTDLQTSGYSLDAVYDYEKNVKLFSRGIGQKGRRRRATGHQRRHQHDSCAGRTNRVVGGGTPGDAYGGAGRARAAGPTCRAHDSGSNGALPPSEPGLIL